MSSIPVSSKRTRLLFLGDRGVGKTCMTIAVMTGKYPSEYIPSASFESWCHNEVIDLCAYNISITEAPGQDYYDDVRFLAYIEDPDVVLICFDVSNRASFENVERKWLAEVKHQAPYLPVVLVATKTDLLNSSTDSKETVSTLEGESLAHRLGMCAYLECSALMHEGITDILPTSVRIAFKDSRTVKQNRRLSYQRKIVFSSISTLGRFIMGKLRCVDFAYCTRKTCEFHHRGS